MRSAQGGFSLILVVWLVALLSAVGLQWSVGVRREALALGSHVERVEAGAAAEAGLAIVRATLDRRLALLAASPQADIDPWRLTEQVRFSGHVSEESDLLWRALVHDLGGRLNLNTTEPAQLRRLLEWLPVDARSAAHIADATADWRDADEWPRVEGAERDAYDEAGRARLPSNRPFQSVPEWASVLGVTAELYDRISPYLSVDGSGRINIATAPDPVLVSLPGFGPEALAVLRSGTPVYDLSGLLGALSATARAAMRPHVAWLQARTTFSTEELHIEVVGYRPASTYETRMSVVLARSGHVSSVVSARVAQ